MLKQIRSFIFDEDGMGTIEIVIIIAVLVALALLFKSKLQTFATSLMDQFFKTPEKPDMVGGK